MLPRKANSIARELVVNNSKELDITTKEFSYGESADTMIEASETGIKLGWRVKNNTPNTQILYIAASSVLGQVIENGGNTIVPGVTAQSNVVFATGNQLVNGAEYFKIEEIDSDRKIKDFRGFSANSPVQITGLHLKSRKISNGAADDSNYEYPIVAYHVSPFYETKKNEFQLRLLQDSNMNSPQFAVADFLAKKFQALVSQEHVIAIQVNADTELAITASIGAMDSRPQRFWRATRDANKVLAPFRKA